jgi:hypothetical protein
MHRVGTNILVEHLKHVAYKLSHLFHTSLVLTQHAYDLVIPGRYILQPDVMRILEKQETGAGGEIQLADAMLQLIVTCLPFLHPSGTRDRPLDNGPPVSHPGVMRASGLHPPGLTPADAAYSAGVSQPRAV